MYRDSKDTLFFFLLNLHVLKKVTDIKITNQKEVVCMVYLVVSFGLVQCPVPTKCKNRL